jgi:hypothetical protein
MMTMLSTTTNHFHSNAYLDFVDTIEPTLSPNLTSSWVFLCLFPWVVHFEREMRRFVKRLLYAFLEILQNP